MLGEALVLFACVHNTGCQDTSGVYFQQNPDVKQAVEVKSDQIKQIVGPDVVNYAGPLLFVVSGGSGVLKLTGNSSVQISKNNVNFTIRWGF